MLLEGRHTTRDSSLLTPNLSFGMSHYLPGNTSTHPDTGNQDKEEMPMGPAIYEPSS